MKKNARQLDVNDSLIETLTLHTELLINLREEVERLKAENKRQWKAFDCERDQLRARIVALVRVLNRLTEERTDGHSEAEACGTAPPDGQI